MSANGAYPSLGVGVAFGLWRFGHDVAAVIAAEPRRFKERCDFGATSAEIGWTRDKRREYER